MRSKRALLNLIASILMELVNVAYSFYLPRLIIATYGSESNGLVITITQWLSYTILLQSGVGGVVRAAMYKPLAAKDDAKLASIIKTTEAFFRKLGLGMILYMCALGLFLGAKVDSAGGGYVIAMTFAIGLSNIVQYCFGITKQMMLMADQRGYVYYLSQTAALVINLLLSVLLIRLRSELLIVKALGTVVLIGRPIFISLYVNRKYRLRLKTAPKDYALLKQRWDGMAFTVAYFIHTRADVMLLTVFGTMASVSVYTVYQTVAAGVSSVISILCTPFQAVFGDMIAREERMNLADTFRQYALVIHMALSVLFGVALAAMMPFVRVYTLSFADARSYAQPLFGCLLILSEAVYCFRMPYHTVIVSAGHYRQTKRGAYIEAAVNIAVSAALLPAMGLVGIAIGTLAAMMFRTLDYMFYLRGSILFLSMREQLTRFIVTFANIALVYAVGRLIPAGQGWLSLLGYCALTGALAALITLCLNLCFYRRDIRRVILRLKPLASALTQGKRKGR